MKTIRILAATASLLFLCAESSFAACGSKNMGIYTPTADPTVWVLESEIYDPDAANISYDPTLDVLVTAAGGGGGGPGSGIVNGADPGLKHDAEKDGASREGPGTGTNSVTCFPPIIVTGSPFAEGHIPFLPIYHSGAGGWFVRWFDESGYVVPLKAEVVTCNGDMATIVAEACHYIRRNGWWWDVGVQRTYAISFADGWRTMRFVRRDIESQCSVPVGNCNSY